VDLTHIIEIAIAAFVMLAIFALVIYGATRRS